MIDLLLIGIATASPGFAWALAWFFKLGPFARKPIIYDSIHCHHYCSTACLHALHDQCRKTCKFCDAPCFCNCHRRAG